MGSKALIVFGVFHRVEVTDSRVRVMDYRTGMTWHYKLERVTDEEN